MSSFELAIRVTFQFCWHTGVGQTSAHASDEFILDEIFPRKPFLTDSRTLFSIIGHILVNALFCRFAHVIYTTRVPASACSWA